MPKPLLFTLPTIAPTYSKLPRVLAICKTLDRDRFQPLVSVDHAGRLHGDGLRLFNKVGVSVHLIRMSPHKQTLARSLVEMAATPRVLRQHGVVIQHSSDYGQCWTEPLLARMGGVRHWVSTKTNMEHGSWHWRLRLQLSKRIIVQTPGIAAHLGDMVPGIESRVVIIPNGVDTEAFKPRLRSEKLVEELSLSDNNLILGCIAHLVPVKDHLSMLRALSTLQRSDIKLLLIGAAVDTKYTERVKRLACELHLESQVYFLGQRADISQLHTVMNGLILTSKSESLSNAVLEGMSSGLPIIASDVGGMCDTVQTSVNGWLIPRGEDFVERLAIAIDDWAADSQRRQAYGAASRRIVQERFSLSQMVQKHIQLYESLLED